MRSSNRLQDSINPRDKLKNKNPDKLRIAISGASGLIGSALSDQLRSDGHTVLRMVRSKTSAPDSVYWNILNAEIDTDALEGIDAIVHLAGEPVFAVRWTDEKKRRIMDSRVNGTRLIADAIKSLRSKPAVLVSASAIGIYGDRGSELLTEASEPDSDSFLAQVCKAWEYESQEVLDSGVRVVNPRIGLVLSPEGGILEKMLTPFKLGIGGRLGGKNQYASWITIDDIVGALYYSILSPTVSGPVNLTAPNPVTMDELTETLGKVLNRPSFFPIPSALVRLATGEVADEVLLASQRVLPEELLRRGYDFRFNNIEAGLKHLLD